MYREYDDATLKKLQSTELEILEEFIILCKKHNLQYFMTFGSAIGAVRHKGFIPWDDDVDVGMLREDYNKLLEIMQKDLNSKYKLLTPKIDANYAGTVTHFQKKNTKFVSYGSKHLKCDLCIDIDIFVFDNIADDLKLRKKQVRLAWVLGKLLILRGNAYPSIPLKGISAITAKILCWIIHYALVICHITVENLYKKFIKVITKYNHIQTKDVTTFEDPTPYKNIIYKEGIFPLKEVQFEKIKVKIPNNNHELLTRMYGDYMKLPSEKERINHYPFILDFGDGKNV